MDARVVGVSDQVGGIAAVDDMGDGMQCINHPYRNNPGGICAFCLQEKLGKLVSSSFPLPIRGSSSSSSSPPSFRSDAAASGVGVGVGVGHVSSNGGLVTSSAASLSLSLSVHPTSITRTRNDNSNDRYYNTSRRARIPFLLAKKKKKMMVTSSSAASASASDRAADIVFKRSKSTTTPRRGHGHSHFLEAADNEDFSPRKRGFWSFLYHSSSSKKKADKITALATPNGGSSHVRSSLSTKNSNVVIEEENDGDGDDEDDSPNSAATHQASASSFDRKVSRSRSVGCGSRSFSGDFFERISTGFGDCTLRRVESQREGKPKMPNNANAASHHHHHHHHHMKERVKCGGIFGGFIMTSSSSSSSSSSYWVSSSSADHHDHVNGKSLAHGRSKSWGWAFASPMRAFGSKPSSKDGSKRPDHIIREAANKNTTPNLAAIPSLLAVRG